MSPRSTPIQSFDDLALFPYAVGHGDEGVCLLLRMGPYKILLDCGLRDISPLLQEGQSPAHVVLCSHAHRDHAAGLLDFHQIFPQIPIYASDVTSQLLPLNWLQENPEPIRHLCQALPWRSPVEVLEGLVVELFPAGHLPGACVFHLTYTARQRSYSVLYTGDFFLSNSRLVEGLPLDALRGLAPDVLIVEGTFGTSRHPHRRQQENLLAERIYQAIHLGISVLLPVPTMGLGQELLMLLRSHHLFTGRNLNIWVDGTVANACDTYLELLPQFPASVQNFARHQALFWDEKVRPLVRRVTPENRAQVGQAPCIVLADKPKGRMHESTFELPDYCQPEQGNWLILLPHRPQESVSRRKDVSEENNLSPITESYLLAQHSDGNGTTQLIHNLRPQHIVFVHGSTAYLSDLTALDELHNRYHIHSPPAGHWVPLPIGETFIQPTLTENIYEGEVMVQPASPTENRGTIVNINLPGAIVSDPRWENLADTGLIEARWQGEQLVLRGVSQRELLSQSSNAKVPQEMESCGNCLHQRGQRCYNPKSPLCGFKVTPEGSCLVFESLYSHPESFLNDP